VAVSLRPHQTAQGCPAGAVDLIFTHKTRVRHARPLARAAQCQQIRFVDGARSTRDPAAHQRIGERHPLPRHPTQGQRLYPAATSDVTAAMPSSASPKPAPSSKSRSGTIWATDSPSRAPKRFHTCPKSSSPEPNRPDRHHFCPSYNFPALLWNAVLICVRTMSCC